MSTPPWDQALFSALIAPLTWTKAQQQEQRQPGQGQNSGPRGGREHGSSGWAGGRGAHVELLHWKTGLAGREEQAAGTAAGAPCVLAGGGTLLVGDKPSGRRPSATEAGSPFLLCETHWNREPSGVHSPLQKL